MGGMASMAEFSPLCFVISSSHNRGCVFPSHDAGYMQVEIHNLAHMW